MAPKENETASKVECIVFKKTQNSLYRRQTHWPTHKKTQHWPDDSRAAPLLRLREVSCLSRWIILRIRKSLVKLPHTLGPCIVKLHKSKGHHGD